MPMIFGCSLLGMVGAQTPQTQLDPLVLTGTRGWGAWGEREVRLDSQRLRATDGASLLECTPGVAVVRNGSQTGIMQMRGLSGERVKVLIDGMQVSPACPNHMDPPMHYASAGSDTELLVSPGVAPVRFGGDSLAGTIRVDRAEPRFTDVGQVLSSGGMTGQYFGSHDGWGAGLELGLRTDQADISYRGGWSHADDLRVRDGRVRASGYDHEHHDLDMTFKTGNGYLSIDVGQSRTRDAGTAALPMDMVEADSWHVGLRHLAKWGDAQWENRLYVHSIDHLMDNFSLRPAPMMSMEAPSTSEDFGWRSQFETEVDEHVFRAGLDLHRNDFDAYQEQVMSGKKRDMFENNQRERAGAYVEWQQHWDEQWAGLLGARADYVKTGAGRVSSGFGSPAVAADAAAFNRNKRSHNDWLTDVAATLSYTPDPRNRYEFSAGVKNRAPSLLERYLWTPLGASAGMADGRTYLGNQSLDPETSFQLTMSASHQAERWGLHLSPFYHRVNDYIEGRPIDRKDMAGNPVLQFQNTDKVDLYGLEMLAHYRLTEQLELAAQCSYVRGKNKDTDEDLYRIAPFHGLVDLAWQLDRWEAHCELDWAASQHDVSSTRDEDETSGYALVHLRGSYEWKEGTRVELGVENLFDEDYASHLSGVNRVGASDLDVGQKIPGAGRFFYANLSWSF